MIGIPIHSTLAASWLICNSCVSNVSRERVSLSETAEQKFVICHSAPRCQKVMKTVAERRERERNEERGEVSANEFRLSVLECLWLGCGSADRQAVVGPGLPKRHAD